MNHHAAPSEVLAVKTFAVIAVVAVIGFACDTRSTRIASYDDCVLGHSKGIANQAVLDTIKVSCKQKHPKTFDFVAIAKSANAPDWSEVAAMKEIRTLGVDEREGARSQYCSDIIHSRVHPDFIAEARTQFDGYARGVEKQVARAVTADSNPSGKAPTTAYGGLCMSDAELREVLIGIHTRNMGMIVGTCARRFPNYASRAMELSRNFEKTYAKQIRANNRATIAVFDRAYPGNGETARDRNSILALQQAEMEVESWSQDQCRKGITGVEAAVVADDWRFAVGIPVAMVFKQERERVPTCR